MICTIFCRRRLSFLCQCQGGGPGREGPIHISRLASALGESLRLSTSKNFLSVSNLESRNWPTNFFRCDSHGVHGDARESAYAHSSSVWSCVFKGLLLHRFQAKSAANNPLGK